jgi:predicted site-specific integrase-resolvase
MTDRKTLTPKEAAEYLKYSEAALELWRKEGRGPKFYKPEHKIYYFQEDLDAWIKEGEKQ